MRQSALRIVSLSAILVLPGAGISGAQPTRAEAAAALRKACGFFREDCSKHGGYVWRYSRDLSLSEGEAETGPDTIWVQPPGTPAIGLAYLDAYDVTGDAFYLQAAEETAGALVRGQLQSGGWHYSIHFDPAERARWGYRDNAAWRPSRRGRKNETNVTVIDDDTTPCALRFLMRLDKLHDFQGPEHETVTFALEALLIAQYPNGAWTHNWDVYPAGHDVAEFPVLKASYPEDWSRKWLNDWPGRYYTNDNISGNMLATMLAAYETYGDERYLESARRTGEFFLLAQMPEPQPAWAQQYDVSMHPCWDRKFEPPAISGLESQYVIEALLALYRVTGDERVLAAAEHGTEYLRASQLPNGRLARFYELRSNRPLYFTKDYELTYDSAGAPDHYGFEHDSRVAEFAAECARLRREGIGPRPTVPINREELEAQIRQVIDAQDDRGAWLDARGMKGFNKASQDGVYQSETFIRNVGVLCEYLRDSGS
jgi:hypothetical protein